MNSGLKGILNSTTIADRILLSVLILLSFSGIVFIKEVLPEGRTVRIEVDGQPVYVLPIDKDRIVSVNGSEGKTVIEIKDQRVRITESPCPNKLCVHRGWIEHGAIICLPNRVVITVGDYKKGDSQRGIESPFDAVDAITG
ncbi:MAG: NusG domain II-containing protein [Nitrospirota bacterium]